MAKAIGIIALVTTLMILTSVHFVEVLAQTCTTYNTDTTANDFEVWVPWMPSLTGGERLLIRVKGASPLLIALANTPKLDTENYYVTIGLTQDKAGDTSVDDASIYKETLTGGAAPADDPPPASSDSGDFGISTSSFTDLHLVYSETGGVGTLALGLKDFVLPTVSFPDSSPIDIVWVGLDSDATAAEWQICDPVPRKISGTGLGSASISGQQGSSGEAQAAYDGSTSQTNAANCAESTSVNNPLWRFTFSGSIEKIVSLVAIWRRTGGGSGANRMLTGTQVWVASQGCTTTNANQCGPDITSMENGYSAGCPITKKCSADLVGNSVTIRRPEASSVLTLCEVEIYGMDVTQDKQSKLYFSMPTFTVLESEAVDLTVTRDLVTESTCSFVRLATSQGTATDTTDYTLDNTNLPAFLRGQTSRFRTLTAVDDDNYEGDEMLTVTLDLVHGGYFGTPTTATVIIKDDDAEYGFCKLKYTILESDSNGVDVGICRIGHDKAGSVDIQIRRGFGSATSNADYPVFPLTTVEFPEGSYRAIFNVKVSDDSATEADETFMLQLTNAQTGGVSVHNGTTTVCITNDDGTTYALEKSVESVTETIGGVNLEVCVVRSGYAGNSAIVRLTTSGNTALEGSDFVALNEELTFNVGDTKKCEMVTINDDSNIEPDETFQVQLTELDSLGVIAPGGPDYLTVTIQDDDAEIELVDHEFSVPEGIDTITITARRTGILTAPATAVLTAVSDTAIVGQDFQSVVGMFSFSAGASMDSVTVKIIDDPLDEEDERFYLQLSTSSGSPVIDEAVVIIRDNEDSIVIDGTRCLVKERADELVLGLVRYGDTTVQESVVITTIDGTARAGTDYRQLDQVITFSSGDDRLTASISLIDDNIRDGDKTFQVEVASRETGTTLDSVSCTIEDDDAEFALSSAQYEVLESENSVRVIVTKTGNSDSTGSVELRTNDGTAIGGSDFAALGPITLNFAIGETEKHVDIFITPDENENGNTETFSVELFNPTNGVIGSPGIATVSIIEQQATYHIESVTKTVSEADPTGSVLLVIIRENYNDIAGTVTIVTAEETATAPDDFTEVQTTLTFDPGQTRAIVPIFIKDDEEFEETETFRVVIISATGGVPSPAQSTAVITITDDDTSSSTSLTTGATVGIAIGSAVAGIAILGLFGVISIRILSNLRSRAGPRGNLRGRNADNPAFSFNPYEGYGYGGNTFGGSATFSNPAFQTNYFQQGSGQYL